MTIAHTGVQIQLTLTMTPVKITNAHLGSSLVALKPLPYETVPYGYLIGFLWKIPFFQSINIGKSSINEPFFHRHVKLPEGQKIVVLFFAHFYFVKNGIDRSWIVIIPN